MKTALSHRLKSAFFWILGLVPCLLGWMLGRLLAGIQAGRRPETEHKPPSFYQGPAKLELFGRQHHTGWIRETPERIDMLTLEGEALQFDPRARYRLTPLSWQALAEASNHKADERRGVCRSDRFVREGLERARDEYKARVGHLRTAVADALEALAGSPRGSNVTDAIVKLEAAREKDDEADIPF